MNREQKAAVIEQIATELDGCEAIFALDYRGITVAQVGELRTKLRDAQTRLQVTKNSLCERAADQAGLEALKPLLAGPTALAFVRGDAAVAAKLLSDTAKALRGPLAFKGGFLNGAPLSAEQIDAIAKLPSRGQLEAQFVATVAAPLSGLARTLNALIAGVAIQLGQIRDRGLIGAAADAPTQAPASASAQVSATTSTEGSSEDEPSDE